MKPHRCFAVFICALTLLSTQCDEDDILSSICDFEVLIDNEAYTNAESGNYSLNEAYIEADCLFINISASGCDGSTWEMHVIDSGNVAESVPSQRFLKFQFINNESCLAVISKVRSFDLTPLRVAETDELVLNIENFPESLLYSY
ncbi:MAG: hypothetical protein HKN40_07440 [Winogradskyella sp.]|uniref:hypothetical protein n=1 Tax=Winogradskyella sp. TaxID=1883156 RepID=UPI0017BF3C4B|nr:hypothetical protein [Winogradskyella sp.]